MIEQSNSVLKHNPHNEGGLTVQITDTTRGDIIDKLHNKDINSELAPSEVSPTLLCSNHTVKGDTSLGVNSDIDFETESAKKLAEIMFNKYVIWKQQKQLNTLSSTEE